MEHTTLLSPPLFNDCAFDYDARIVARYIHHRGFLEFHRVSNYIAYSTLLSPPLRENLSGISFLKAFKHDQ